MKKYSVVLTVMIALAFFLGMAGAQSGHDLFQKALAKERAEGDLQGAIALYQQVIDDSQDEALAAKAQLRIGLCYEKLGSQAAEKAKEAFQKVIANFPAHSDQVKIAREKLSLLTRAEAVVEERKQDLRIRKVWSGTGVDMLGGVSPDGKYLCLTDWDTGDLAVRELSTGKNRRLTNKGSWLKSQEFPVFEMVP